MSVSIFVRVTSTLPFFFQVSSDVFFCLLINVVIVVGGGVGEVCISSNDD